MKEMNCIFGREQAGIPVPAYKMMYEKLKAIQ